MIIIIIYIL